MAVPNGSDSVERTRYYYLAKLDRITELGEHVGSAIDKALITLSGGALVFSMTFVERLAPQKLLLPILFASWAFFALAIIAVVIAMRGAQNDLAAQGIRASEVLKSIEHIKDSATRVSPTGAVAVNPKVWRWNLIALVLFILGVLALSIFVGWNMFKSKPVERARDIAGVTRAAFEEDVIGHNDRGAAVLLQDGEDVLEEVEPFVVSIALNNDSRLSCQKRL
jgi:hypothetical protein